MQPDFHRRAQLAERMDEPCTREELRACLRDIARVNRWLLAYRPVLQWLDSLDLARFGTEMGEPVRILDVGCGYGDVLRRVERWARDRRIAVELTGIDLNPDATAIAAESSESSSAIRWVAADVFAYATEKPPHLVVSSLFTHHLTDAEVVRFLRWMEGQAEAGWFVSDLVRHPTPYRLFRLLAKGTRLHPFVQYDGPVSIARAFVEEDWRKLCAEAGLSEGDIAIRGYTPGKLCVMRRKQRGDGAGDC
jgi:2-polyprenyl-3-methyl-5-hydroxy-6-metoxy-1,4-benzoquinol methylase